MKKYPPCYLTDKDIEWFEKLTLTVDGQLLKITDIYQFLRHIEQNYRIHHFKLFDYTPEDMDGNDVIPIFYRPEYFHAALIYVVLHGRLAVTTLDNDKRDESKDKFNAFCWRQIKRIENDTLFDKRGFQIRVNTIFYLELLLTVAWQLKDYPTLIKAYTKVIEYFDIMKTLGLWKDILQQSFSGLSIPLEGLVNDALSLLSYPVWISIKNPKLIKCFIDSISYAFDDEPCLIMGETGTGKELIARTIHGLGSRRKNSFSPVNCAGFTDGLFNSEIQGIVEGAATGISTTRLGVFLDASGTIDGKTRYGYVVDKNRIGFRTMEEVLTVDPTLDQLNLVGGTVFLDEINSLDLSHQAAFLRIIQESEVRVVGEDQARKFQVKLLCAANSNILKLTKERKFREDLYYRIGKGIVEVPPLREMKDSFEEIVHNSVKNIKLRNTEDGKVNVTTSAIRKLKAHQWPGNFRELQSVLYRALKKMEIENATTIKPAHVEYDISPPTADYRFDFSGMDYDTLISDYLNYLYITTNGNQTQAANMAGMKRNRLRDHWVKYGIIKVKAKMDSG